VSVAVELTRKAYLERLERSSENGLIKVVTGVSECGKTYVLFNTFYDYLLSKGVGESHIIEIPLSDRGFSRLQNNDALIEYIKDRIEDDDNYFVFIENIQLMDDYSDIMKRLQRLDNADIFLTGDDLNFLSGVLMKEFAEECQQIRILPFSFKDAVSLNKEFEKNRELDYFFKYGGLPMTWWMDSEEEKEEHLRKMYEKCVASMIETYNIKNETAFVNLINVLSRAVGTLINPLQLENYFNELGYANITDKTAKKFIGYLEEQCIITKVLRYDLKKRKYINTPAKYYFEDVGLKNVVNNFETYDEGAIQENIIYNELISRGYNVDMGVIELNYKDKFNNRKKQFLEIDFVATKDDKRYYIQSAHTRDVYKLAKMVEYKWKTYSYVRDSFKKILVVHDDIKLKRDEYGIVTMSLKEFLLNENSLDL